MSLEELEKELKAAEWIKLLKEIFTDLEIPMTYENEAFRTAERFFWIGLITGIGSESLPSSIQKLIHLNKSPVMEFKIKRVRKRGKKEPPDLLK
jgi:hypothetical protein